MPHSTDFITLSFNAQDPNFSLALFFISLSHISALPARLHVFSASWEFCLWILIVFLSSFSCQSVLFQGKWVSENILFYLFLPCKIQRNKWNREMKVCRHLQQRWVCPFLFKEKFTFAMGTTLLWRFSS